MARALVAFQHTRGEGEKEFCSFIRFEMCGVDPYVQDPWPSNKAEEEIEYMEADLGEEMD